MKNFNSRLALLIASFCAGHFLIGYFGNLYANESIGYRRGNRRRIVSILKLQWIMLYIDLAIYAHLFSFFSSLTFFNFGKGELSAANSTQYIKTLRFNWFCVYLFVISLAHLAYFFYLVESFEVPWLIYYISQCCGGIWLHLCAFSIFFVALNCFLNTLFRWPRIEAFFKKYLFRCRGLYLFCCNSQFQVLSTLIITSILSLSHWYFSDIVYVKSLTIPLNATMPNNEISGLKSLKAVVLTDLHAGACVYKNQIIDIVDKVNELNAEVVFIIGDAIDAPRSLIEDRASPLKYLKSTYGTYFVTGNHEYYYGDASEWIDLFKAYGIVSLRNSHIVLKGICIVGLDDISSKNSGIVGHAMNVSAIGKCPKNLSTVVLAHNPSATKEISEYSRSIDRPVDLILSGHTHAGQYYVMIPYVLSFLPYFYGEYNIQSSRPVDTKLLVSAGTLYQGAPMKMPFMSEIWLLNLTYKNK